MQVNTMSAPHKQGRFGTLRDVFVAHGARVVFGESTHAVVRVAFGHAHLARGTVGVLRARANPTDAATLAVVNVFVRVVLPQKAHRAIVVVRLLIMRALRVLARGVWRLHAVAERALHLRDVIPQKYRFEPFVCAQPARHRHVFQWVDGLHPMAIVITKHTCVAACVYICILCVFFVLCVCICICGRCAVFIT
jgi:hypothetical protein